MNEILARAALAAVILGAVLAIAVLARAVARRRARRVLSAPADPSLATGAVTLLYFHGDHCGDCLVQEHELDRLLMDRPDLAIRADHAPSPLSARFGVLSVPSTVVLAADGKVVAVNYGLARLPRLVEQVQSADGRPVGARQLHHSRI